MSDDIILGLDENGDFLSSIESSLTEKKKSDSVKVKKMGAIENRKTNLKNLALAIENRDVDKVQEILEENPKLSLADNAYDFTELSFRYFNPQIMRLMLKKGLNFDIRSLASYNISSDILHFFIDYSKNETEIDPQGSQKSKYGDYHKQWDDIYGYLLSNLKEKNFKKYISILDKSFPGIEEIQYSSNVFDILDDAPVEGNDWHKNKLRVIKEDIWKLTFTSSFSHKEYFKGNSFTAQSMKFFTDFLKENKNIQDIWNEVQKNNKEDYLKRKAWYDKYLPKGMPMKETPFYKNMLVATRDVDEQSPTRLKRVDYGIKFVEKYSKGMGINIKNDMVCSVYNNRKFYLSHKDYVEVMLDDILARVDFTQLKHKTTKEVLFDSNPIAFKPPSFIHHLIASGSDLVLFLVKNKNGQETFLECLEDINIFYSFITNTSAKTFISLLKKVPQLKDMKDIHGNSIGHIYIGVNREKSTTHLLAMAKIAPQWFEGEDYSGETLLDTILSVGGSQETIAQINKYLILLSLKREDDIKGKLASKKVGKVKKI